MRRCLVSFGFGLHAEMLGLAKPGFSDYAGRHGLNTFFPTAREIDRLSKRPGWSDRPESWWKIPVWEHLFDSGFDEIFWVDADCLIVDPTENIFDGFPADKLLQSVRHQPGPDAPSIPCLGVCLIRNLPETRSLLSLTWDQTDLIRHAWWEQTAFCRFGLDDNSHLTRHGVATLPDDHAGRRAKFWEQCDYGMDYRWSPHVNDSRGIPGDAKLIHFTCFPDRAGEMRRVLSEKRA